MPFKDKAKQREYWNRYWRERYKTDQIYKSKINAKTKKWYQVNREYALQVATEYAKEYAPTRRDNERRQYRRTRTDLLQLLGNSCVVCGCNDRRALQFDHINGGGKKEFKRFGCSGNAHEYYSKHPEQAKMKLQVLCANCNWIKRFQELSQSVGKKKMQLLELLGKKCIRCGFDNLLTLQLDHINGGGCSEVKKFGGGTQMQNYYIRHPEEAKQTLQVLCANCNWIKRHDRSEHGKRRSSLVNNQSSKD